MSTIKQVAARAGVSFTTVSHVVNRTRPVSDSARVRVERAIADLGYFPSAVARALKTAQTRILGVIVPNIINPFFSELVRGIEDACERNNYSVFLCNGDDDRDRQGRSLDTLLGRRVDGVILATPAGPATTLARRIAATKLPTAIVDRPVPGARVDHIAIDHAAGARLAMEHLLELGHRRIAHISGPSAFEVSRARAGGWRQALQDAGVEPREDWLVEGDFLAPSGHEVARKLLAQGEITAIFASNDMLAFGALWAAAEAGWVVPRALSVVGFDGIEMGGFISPALTTVGVPIRQMGETAAMVLIDRLAGRTKRAGETVVTPRLIVRESTGPARGA